MKERNPVAGGNGVSENAKTCRNQRRQDSEVREPDQGEGRSSDLIQTDLTEVSRATLPALVDRAGRRLLEAKSSAEVLEAKKLAQAALHYAKVTDAANDTHADCLRIITRAEMRMADEIDRGQAEGELAGAHRPEKASSSSTLSDLGVRRDQLHDWRQVRDAGEDVVEGAIQTALAEGRAPTKTDVNRHVRGTFGTGDIEWYTPIDYLDIARGFLGDFDLDPASSDVAQQTVRATTFFTENDNGLTKEWHGRVWLNPPYTQPLIAQFIDKLITEFEAGRTSEAILLTHNYTDTTWFHRIAYATSAVCFTKGRVKFINADGSSGSPTQGQAFSYFGDRPFAFARAFRGVGFVMSRLDGLP